MIQDENAAQLHNNEIIAGQYNIPQEYNRDNNIITPPCGTERSLYDYEAGAMEYAPYYNNANQNINDADVAALREIDSFGLIGFEENNYQYGDSQLHNNSIDFNEPQPMAITNPNVFPNLDEYNNDDLNFDVELNSKKFKGYSSLLQKIFIHLNENIYMDFEYSPKNFDQQFYIRAMMVFSEDLSSPVKRCKNHVSENNNESNSLKYNVIRCENTNVVYTGEVDGKNANERLALLVPLNSKTMSKNVIKETVALNFVCSNSCIGRKSTSLIFTLETNTGDVLAKKVISVKICSAPNRDKKSEELKFKRTAIEAELSPPGKHPSKIMKIIKREPGTPASTEEPGIKFELNTCLNSTMVHNNIDSSPISLPISPCRIIKSSSEGEINLILKLPYKGIAHKCLNALHDVIAGEILRKPECAYKLEDTLNSLRTMGETSLEI